MSIRMHVNELPWGISDGFGNSEDGTGLKLDFDKIELNRYPDRDYLKLRSAIGNYLNLSKVKVSPENICLGNGSDELIWLIFSLILDKGDKVLIHEPTFGEYERVAKLLKAETISALSQARPKLAVICNPNNPTGELISKNDLVSFMDDFDGYVLLDEAYMDFCREEESLISQINDYPKLIVLRTFSKGFGLAGIRLGYSISSMETASKLNDIRPPYNINGVTEYIALEALAKTEEFRSRIEKVVNERDRVADNLSKMDVEFIKPSGNFIFVTGKKTWGENYVERLKGNLKEKDIQIRFFDDKEMNGSFRFTIGKREENDKLLEVLKAI